MHTHTYIPIPTCTRTCTNAHSHACTTHAQACTHMHTLVPTNTCTHNLYHRAWGKRCRQSRSSPTCVSTVASRATTWWWCQNPPCTTGGCHVTQQSTCLPCCLPEHCGKAHAHHYSHLYLLIVQPTDPLARVKAIYFCNPQCPAFFTLRCNEFRRFCPSIKVVKFIGNAEERVRRPGYFSEHVTHACTCSETRARMQIHMHKHTCVGLARTIYIRCIYRIFGREITKYTVIYGVYVRFWPTLHMCTWMHTYNKQRGYVMHTPTLAFTHTCTRSRAHTHKQTHTHVCIAHVQEAIKREHIQPGKFDVMITSYEMVIK